MADIAAQREARRKKLAMNAEARMNRLLGKDSNIQNGMTPTEDSEISHVDKLTSHGNDSKEESESPYNLRQRGRDSTKADITPPTVISETSPSQKSSNLPYKVVEDPEVPDLGEFLAKQEATKAAEVKSSRSQITNSQMRKWTMAQYVETIKIIGCILTALVSRYALWMNFSSFVFQSIYLPFIIFEATAMYIINTHLQHMSSLQPKGSMLSSALVLCGIRPDLINLYNRIMSHVTLITSDFFTYTFIVIIIHACVG